MKIAVCIATTRVDLFGYLERYAVQFAQAATERGLTVEVLRYPNPNFYSRLIANLADPDCIIHFYGYIFDLNIPDSLANGLGIHVLDAAQATTVATIGDHPFSTFMHQTVANAHPRMKFIVMDEAFQDEMLAMSSALHGALFDHQPIPPPTNFDDHRSTNFGERDFDLIIPMFVRDMTEHDIKLVLSHLSADWFAEVMANTYETARCEPDRSPFHIFHELFQSKVGLSLEQVRDQNPGIVSQILNAVTAVDAIVRQERRQQMIASLLKSIGDLSVAITCDAFPALRVDDNVRFLGKQTVTDVAGLMANTRAVLNCNPSYPSSLHERVVSGMMYRSCVITDVNREIAQRFTCGEIVPYAPGSTMTISDIYDAYDVERVAMAGASKVENDPSYSWNGHIDRLMRAAAA